ncbi:DUF1467 family protein [Fulvimarina sp. 2208YS6-2-32]|uniref:DUF1467 family protein n=1 Tax=Fulvimarina uroteuthidis TaxID=3098149 RepID=A0ABU5I334_9HYPH|nr:DUF1467 family protein [Fulvimarina sp. 2208YS6-2-32]MDY8109510.1 DUF1467 family protein [Fulvimarina sp. 2208YS6-2-32]
MGWVSGLAIFFIIWWTVLFAVLPFGNRIPEGEDQLLGTQEGTPSNPRILRKAMITTIFAVIVFAAFYTVTEVIGFGFSDFPVFIPAPSA